MPADTTSSPRSPTDAPGSPLSPADAPGSPGLRSDARRNRQLILDAAREVFSEQGLDASFGEIARRAGVGEATLYRRFPTRPDLHAAVLAEGQESVRRILRRVLEIEDAWTALATYCELVCRLRATSRAVGDLMMAVDSPATAELREASLRTMGELVARAHRQRTLHPDVTVDDVGLALSSVHIMIHASARIAPEAWRRHLALTLRGLRAEGPPVSLPAPSLTLDQLKPVLRRLYLNDRH